MFRFLKRILRGRVSETFKLFFSEDFSHPTAHSKGENLNSDQDVACDNEEIVHISEPDFDSNYPPIHKWTKDCPQDQIIGSTSSRVLTRAQQKQRHTTLFMKGEYSMYNVFISKVEPNNVKEALLHSDWVEAMQDELLEFERNKVWSHIETPKDVSVVGLKWVFRNKSDKDGNVVRNKARLVVKGYCQQEGINYDETFAPVARIE